jgi:FkbM family methyltransferase
MLACMDITHAGRAFRLDVFSHNDLIAERIRAAGTFYEADLLQYLARMGVRGEVVIDVGAQIGNHAVFFGNFLARHVVCVEPNPAVLPILRRNVANNPGAYTIVPAGLGAAPGTAALSQPDAGNTGTAQLHDAGEAGEIPLTTLDAIAPPGVVLVKIDVEGMELEVLRGGQQLLRTQHPDLVLEAWTPETHAAHRAFLAPLGYVPLTWWGITPTWHFAYRPGVTTRVRSHALRWAYRFACAIRRRWPRKAISMV